MTRLLVVEDDDDFSETLAEIFQAAGYSVKQANNGHKGLHLCRQWRPHIVVTDLIMPEMEGITLIRELTNDASHPTIIAISGGGEHPLPEHDDMVDSYLESARLLGASLAYAKPVDFCRLLRDVTALTSESNSFNAQAG